MRCVSLYDVFCRRCSKRVTISSIAVVLGSEGDVDFETRYEALDSIVSTFGSFSSQPQVTQKPAVCCIDLVPMCTIPLFFNFQRQVNGSLGSQFSFGGLLSA